MEDDISEASTSVLVQSVVLLYDSTGDNLTVNDARKWLFTLKFRSPAEYTTNTGSTHVGKTLNGQVTKQAARTKLLLWLQEGVQ